MRKLLRWSLLITLFFPFTLRAELDVYESIGQVHNPAVTGGGYQTAPGSTGSVYGKDGQCRIGRGGRGGVNYGGGGGGTGGGTGGVGSIAGGGAGGGGGGGGPTGTTTPPPGPPEPPATPNPSIVDVQGFVTRNCNKCHTTEAKLNAENKIRIVKGGKELTLKEAMDAVNTNPQMAKVRANAGIVNALSTWSTLP